MLPRNASPVRLSRRCNATGRKRSYIGRFQLSAYCIPRTGIERTDPRRHQVELVAGQSWIFHRVAGRLVCDSFLFFSMTLFLANVHELVTQWDAPGAILLNLAGILRWW